MNNAGIAYRYICHKPIAVFIILLLTILSFRVVADNRDISTSASVETLSYQCQDDIGDEIRNNASTTNLHLLARCKVKVKVFFKKYINRSLQVINPFFAYNRICYALQVRNALKPEYYGFLFRYKPF